MTERDKIIETLKQTSDIWKEEERHGYIVSVDLEKIADALIAAGIGDVGETKEKLKKINERILLGDIIACDLSAKCAEYKYRAEVAERAFLILWKECKEKLGWNIDCTMWYAKQAKKELAEGKKDE